MTFNSSIWGPHYWFFLHTCAFTYPKNPNAITKKIYYDLIQNFSRFIPVEKVSSDFEKLLLEYPIQPYLDDKDSLITWVWFIHNKINEKLEKSKITLEQFYNNYFDNYKSNDEKNYKKYNIIKKLVYFSVILLLFFLIYYFYNK